MSSGKKTELRQKEVEVRLRFPVLGFLRSIYANRVVVEKTAENAAIISFALQTKSGSVADFAKIVVSPQGLARHRDSLVGFLDRLPGEVPDLPKFLDLGPGQMLGVADEVLISTGQLDEIQFSAFSPGAASVERPSEIQLQGILRVQCSKSILTALITRLYVE